MKSGPNLSVNLSMQWDFNDWMHVAGAESYAEVARVASELHLLNPTSRSVDVYNEARIRDWANKGLRDYEVALDMIAVLRAIAQKKSREAFCNGNLLLHARTFLKGKSGKPEWDSPNSEQIYKICQITSTVEAEIQTEVEQDHSLIELQTRVRPPAPYTLFGREKSKRDVLSSLQQFPVTVIASIAGNGKTALAWDCARAAFNDGLVIGVDWTTDKRQVIDAYGNLYVHEDRPLDLEQILKSMAIRFHWTDVLTKPPERWISGCADKLRKSRYLIVVDNLETLDDQLEVVRILQDMMTPQGNLAPISSRALITSRVDIEATDPARVDIGGINNEGAKNFLLDLQKRWRIVNPLDEEEAIRLSKATECNPLFMQIALRRYESGASIAELEDYLSKGANFTAFRLLFSDLVEKLSDRARVMAVKAAHHTWVTNSESISRIELRDLWYDYCKAENILPQQEQQEELFAEDILSLLKTRVINIIPGRISHIHYTFHSLIRSYFLPMN